AARRWRRWGDWERGAACAGTRPSGLPKAQAASGARGGGCARRGLLCSRLSSFPSLAGGGGRSGAGRAPPSFPPRLSLALSRCAVSPTQDCPGPDMARGQQKIQSQQKNAKKQAGQKKKQGHDQKAAAKAALIYTCTVCRTQMPDPKTFKQHFESKHPKTPLPPELADVQA
uniref:Zinc finger protein 706 n=1 Tax=Urocitellus parryii TaxID=9999 RepID=A0A8D2HMB3_UROPR